MTKLLTMIDQRNQLINTLETHKKTCYKHDCKHCYLSQMDIDFLNIDIDFYNPLEEYYKSLKRRPMIVGVNLTKMLIPQ